MTPQGFVLVLALMCAVAVVALAVFAVLALTGAA